MAPKLGSLKERAHGPPPTKEPEHLLGVSGTVGAGVKKMGCV